jgi:putative ABC transport system permease protein
MLSDRLIEALRSARAHWLRVMLTSAGILWGMTLFIVLTAAGRSTTQYYLERMEEIGKKVIYAFPGSVSRRGSGPQASRRVVLEREDAPRLPPSSLIDRAGAEVWAGPQIFKGGGHIKVVWVYGVTPPIAPIRNFVVGEGRFINSADVARRRRVVVIGAKVEERLFGRHSALGKTIRIDGHPFRVVGVSAMKGEQMNNMGPRDDEQALVPISTAQALFTGSDAIGHVMYDPITRDAGEASMERTRLLLGRHHRFTPAHEEALVFFNVADGIRILEVMFVALQIFMIGCGLLTLVAGGVGVMNIMLVAVAERTRELGLRKALGATNRDLFVQLVCDTLVITVAAGVGGFAFGGAIIYGLQQLRELSPQAKFLMARIEFAPEVATLAFVVLVTVGLLAGLVPGFRAARLDPAVALRDGA